MCRLMKKMVNGVVGFRHVKLGLEAELTSLRPQSYLYVASYPRILVSSYLLIAKPSNILSKLETLKSSRNVGRSQTVPLAKSLLKHIVELAHSKDLNSGNLTFESQNVKDIIPASICSKTQFERRIAFHVDLYLHPIWNRITALAS
ncbi:uncharacterized protein EAE97_008234 [Botrytis byssoidea]|uniref:Uncharacterized protein n=1 Tax=Botrytis byssoidea TaxID=139641 RepID=A0A9P5M2N6_9HELO|nr:uncharacterized protein EAE97_008234 [Botrytis byssoidea]KAF7935327.1 hypothetical protein EAE97_008234 [Botrytis byssoidea]